MLRESARTVNKTHANATDDIYLEEMFYQCSGGDLVLEPVMALAFESEEDIFALQTLMLQLRSADCLDFSPGSEPQAVEDLSASMHEMWMERT